MSPSDPYEEQGLFDTAPLIELAQHLWRTFLLIGSDENERRLREMAEAHRQLASELETAKQEIDDVHAQVQAWTGPAADEFRRRFNVVIDPQTRADLTTNCFQIAECLETAAEESHNTREAIKSLIEDLIIWSVAFSVITSVWGATLAYRRATYQAIMATSYLKRLGGAFRVLAKVLKALPGMKGALRGATRLARVIRPAGVETASLFKTRVFMGSAFRESFVGYWKAFGIANGMVLAGQMGGQGLRGHSIFNIDATTLNQSVRFATSIASFSHIARTTFQPWTANWLRSTRWSEWLIRHPKAESWLAGTLTEVPASAAHWLTGSQQGASLGADSTWGKWVNSLRFSAFLGGRKALFGQYPFSAYNYRLSVLANIGYRWRWSLVQPRTLEDPELGLRFPTDWVRPEVPPAGTGPAQPSAAHVPPQPQVVSVGEETTLWEVAERWYGDGLLWTRILDANPGIDPNNLGPGTTLRRPDG